jgi:hypothetical protein
MFVLRIIQKKNIVCVAEYSVLTLQRVGRAVMTEFGMITAHNTGEAVSISLPLGHALGVR